MNIPQPVSDLMYARDGRLTRELLLAPGQFGLGQLPVAQQPDATTTMVCGYCSTGCGLKIHLRDGAAISLTPETSYPVNLGMACPKGWEALEVLKASDRATVPLLRDARGQQQPATWDTALRTFVEKFRGIKEQSGPESVAFLSTGQIPTEEMALLGALFKFGMGFIHADANTRQCMATSAVAYKQSFGFDAPPLTYADFEESDVLVFIGANPCLAHPILWERVLRNRRQPEIIVLDPRRTETAMAATLHLPLAPKSDLVLLYGLARELLANDWIDREFVSAFTTGFEEFRKFVQPYTLEFVAQQTGLSLGDLRKTAELIRPGRRVSFWWTMGINQSHEGVRAAQAIINLALLGGHIGKPGTGANSITGQCNAMGSRIFSNTTNLLGGRDFLNPQHRDQVAKLLGIDVNRIPTQNSLAYHEILEGILKGQIRGLWVVATNPAHSWINQHFARDVLSRLDFLVVQDMYHTSDTVQMADLLLPAAGWGEKTGTFINSERRFGVIKNLHHAPGQALADFQIFRAIAEYWGCGEMFREWHSPAAVFQILKRLSAGQPCDITGIRDYDHLDEQGGIQWPCPEGMSRITQERRLFSDGKFYQADGKARFLFESSRPMPEPPSPDYPFVLLTGRGTASQWHTQTRTAKSAVLRKLYPENVYVEINPRDARALKIAPRQMVRVESQRGELVARAFPTPTVAAGQVFIPMHYPETNRLTDAVFDPYSKQPSYKACAVRLQPVSLTKTPIQTGSSS